VAVAPPAGRGEQAEALRGGITRTRAAASSIASGRPSSSFTSGAIAVRSAAVSFRPLFAASARRVNSSAPSSPGSGASA